MSGRGRHFDAIVLGSGLSGLVAALQLAGAGLRVGLFAKGGGYLHFTSGCIDVLGRDTQGRSIHNPLVAVEDLVGRESRHPYAIAGRQMLVDGVQTFQEAMHTANLSFSGDLHANLLLPTAAGSARCACLAPAGMIHGRLDEQTPMLIVGFDHFRDFYPPFLAANLRRICAFPVRHLYLDVPALRGRRHLLPIDLARALDDPAIRQEVGRLVTANLGDAARVGFPAVLGLEAHGAAVAHLEQLIGRPIFEIPTLPPSVAGIRVSQVLRRQLLQRGVRVEIGFWLRGRIEGGRATEIVVDSAGRPTTHRAEAFVLATGGTGGGGISAGPDGALRETVFDLAVQGPRDRAAWSNQSFLGPEPQPISLAGVRTNGHLQPFTASGQLVENVFVTASNLPNWDPVHEGSGEGVALATARKAATEALALLNTSTVLATARR